MKILLIVLMPLFCLAQNDSIPITAVEIIDESIFPIPANFEIHFPLRNQFVTATSIDQKPIILWCDSFGIIELKNLSDGLYFIERKRIIVRH